MNKIDKFLGGGKIKQKFQYQEWENIITDPSDNKKVVRKCFRELYAKLRSSKYRVYWINLR